MTVQGEQGKQGEQGEQGEMQVARRNFAYHVLPLLLKVAQSLIFRLQIRWKVVHKCTTLKSEMDEHTLSRLKVVLTGVEPR